MRGLGLERVQIGGGLGSLWNCLQVTQRTGISWLPTLAVPVDLNGCLSSSPDMASISLWTLPNCWGPMAKGKETQRD